MHDLVALFERGVLAARCVLAVTLARPDAARPRFPSEVAAAVVAATAMQPTTDDGDGDSGGGRGAKAAAVDGPGQAGFASEDDAEVLGAAVSCLAARAGWEARPGPEAFDFAGTFVRLWTLSHGEYRDFR